MHAFKSSRKSNSKANFIRLLFFCNQWHGKPSLSHNPDPFLLPPLWLTFNILQSSLSSFDKSRLRITLLKLHYLSTFCCCPEPCSWSLSFQILPRALILKILQPFCQFWTCSDALKEVIFFWFSNIFCQIVDWCCSVFFVFHCLQYHCDTTKTLFVLLRHS